jgi:GNAT superfamily N-acetyltransferase
VIESSYHVTVRPFNARTPDGAKKLAVAKIKAGENRFPHVYDFTEDVELGVSKDGDNETQAWHMRVKWPKHGLVMEDFPSSEARAAAAAINDDDVQGGELSLKALQLLPKATTPPEVEELLAGKLQPAPSIERGAAKAHSIKSFGATGKAGKPALPVERFPDDDDAQDTAKDGQTSRGGAAKAKDELPVKPTTAAAPTVAAVTYEALKQPLPAKAMKALVAQVNLQYVATEGTLWEAGDKFARTNFAELGEKQAMGRLVVARVAGEALPIGSVCVTKVDSAVPPQWAELGMMAVRPSYERQGVGTGLVRAVEAWCRDRSIPAVRVELLHPRDGKHAYKEGLRKWYAGPLGFKVDRDEPMEKMFPDLVATFGLAVPCNVTVMTKALTTASAAATKPAPKAAEAAPGTSDDKDADAQKKPKAASVATTTTTAPASDALPMATLHMGRTAKGETLHGGLVRATPAKPAQ